MAHLRVPCPVGNSGWEHARGSSSIRRTGLMGISCFQNVAPRLTYCAPKHPKHAGFVAKAKVPITSTCPNLLQQPKMIQDVFSSKSSDECHLLVILWNIRNCRIAALLNMLKHPAYVEISMKYLFSVKIGWKKCSLEFPLLLRRWWITKSKQFSRFGQAKAGTETLDLNSPKSGTLSKASWN